MVGNSLTVFSDVKVELRSIVPRSSNLNFSSRSNHNNDVSCTSSDKTWPTKIFGVKCSSRVGNELTLIKWTLMRFLSLNSTWVLFLYFTRIVEFFINVILWNWFANTNRIRWIFNSKLIFLSQYLLQYYFFYI